VRFPPDIATHSPNAVFYYDAFGMQRRMDYVAEVNNSFLVGHYTGHHQNFDGLVMPTRRRMVPPQPRQQRQPQLPLHHGRRPRC
jgi:hypothetical protein